MFSLSIASTLPIQGTLVAGQWDDLYGFLVWLSVFFFILVVGGMIYFAIKYRAQPGFRPKYITGNHALEAVWIVVPTILLMVIFVWGYVVYRNMVHPPTDAYEIRVIGRQWSWQFQYANGKSLLNEAYVPVNKPVKLIMTSTDVLHSFFVPNFRVKQDVVPGMYTSVWFEATVPGRHQVYCTEYCGTSHSGMLAEIIALTDEQWNAWNAGKPLPEIPSADQRLAAVRADYKKKMDAASAGEGAAPKVTALAEQGKKIAQTKGCIACHSADGTKVVGPSWKGIWGSEEELTDGTKVKVDEDYIRESIYDPHKKLVKPYGPVMPVFKGLVTEEEVNAIIAYIQSLK
jgi:cytochrome c oxidase subunit 2